MAKKGKLKKVQQGRAGQKKKSHKGGEGQWAEHLATRKSSSSRPHWTNIDDDDDDDDYGAPERHFRPFAQNNSSSFIPRNPTVKLRHQAIAFVSAGVNPPIDYSPFRSEQAGVPSAKESDEEVEDTDSDVDDYPHDGAIVTNIVTERDIDISRGAMASMNISHSDEAALPTAAVDAQERHIHHSEPAQALSFIIDTVGDPGLADRSTWRSPSPTPSTSSEEIVLFHGRAKQPTAATDDITPIPEKKHAVAPHLMKQERQVVATTPSSNVTTGPSAVPQGLEVSSASSAHGMPTLPSQSTPGTSNGRAPKPSKFDRETDLNAKWAPAPAGSWWKPARPRPQTPLNQWLGEEDENTNIAVLASEPEQADLNLNYPGTDSSFQAPIQALRQDVKTVLRKKKQLKKSLLEADEIKLDTPKSNRRGKRGRKRDNRQLAGASDSDLANEAEQAAYDDYMTNMKTFLDQDESGVGDSSFAAALAGPSIVIDGQEISDNEILKPDGLYVLDDGNSAFVTVTEEENDDDDDGELSKSHFGSTDLEDELEYTEQQQWEDEEDLRQRRLDAKTDEQIARLFAKQESLGIFDDNIVIDDGEYASTEEQMEGVGDVNAAKSGLANITNLAGRSRRVSARGKRDLSFPNASALADTVEQYGVDGFDIMDFNRPSLRPTKKGRKGWLPPELHNLSDEELKENMKMSWDKDREKKRARKAEREELRARGQLGKSSEEEAYSLRDTFPNGMTPYQIYDELRVFLEAKGQTQRAFPPMDKRDRKELHKIATDLGLKSKSVGSGKNRYPIIIKTKATPITARDELESVLLTVGAGRGGNRRHLRGYSSRSAKGLLRRSARTSAGASKAATTLRDGEVVGAGAAAIGTNNSGHRMMKRMGWSQGQALGKDGEGRLDPVQQVMRSGRAGLG